MFVISKLNKFCTTSHFECTGCVLSFFAKSNYLGTMPCLKIITNLPKSKIPADFTERIIPTLAKLLRKDEDKFTCVIVSDAQLVMQRDSKTPGAVASLESIGHLGPDENLQISKSLSEYFQKELGIVPKRLFLSFYDLKPYDIGANGSTAYALGI